MLNDILILDQQWLPNQSDFPPISWPWYRAWPSPIMSGFHGAFATGVACQQGTLTLPDACVTCLCSNCWDQIPRICHVFNRLFTSNTPWYFFDFALQLLTGTQVAGRQNNIFFSVRRLCTSLCDLPSIINKSHDFLAQIQRNSSEAYRSNYENNMAERSKSFQNFPSVLLSKIFQRFAFKKISNIFQRFAFKNFPAICFQKFSSD